MANSDKNIIITPNIGGTADPKIVFSGADATTAAQNISLNVYPTSAGTLSFEGSAGQLFSITNNLTGTIFSVNDISGIPSIEVDDDGTVRLAEFSGNVLIGTNTDDGTSALQVDGTIAATTINIGGYTAATEAYVTTAISNLVDTAPATLDTLNELAAALGDDANFSTTVTNSIALKAPIASPIFTGKVSAGTGVGGGFRNATYTAGQNAVWSFGNSEAYGISYKQGAPDDMRIHFGNYAAPQHLFSSSGAYTSTGEHYVGSSRVFHDAYHPNADKWTTARTNTVTLTGDVTGTASASVDGTGNWTVSVPAVVANNSHTHNNLTNYVLKAGDTMTGALVGTTATFISDAVAGTNALNILGLTNGNGAAITFSDNGSPAASASGQNGYFTYYHGDSQSYGSGNAFVLSSSETTTTILADGKLMFNEGIYSKPATGTGAGTRKDANWDTAYGWGNHATAGYVSTSGNQSISGIKTFTGTNVTLDTAANTWKYIRLQSAGSVKWDIATNEADDSSSLQFRAGGGSTNRVTVSQAGNLTATGTVTATGGNSTQWNTAYSWGNHASGGYLPGSHDMTLTLSGDVTGSATFTNMGNATLTATVANDSHTHSNYVLKAGDTMTGELIGQHFRPASGYHYRRSNHHTGHLEGSYNNVGANSAKSNPIYTIGSSYNPTDAALSNMYGIGYGHSDATFYGGTGVSGWGMYVAADGDARVFLGGSNGVISSTGEHYVGSSRVFHDTYHPNADKWTTARTNTVTLTGDVTGTASASVDGTGNWTVSVPAVVANDSHTHSIYAPVKKGTATLTNSYQTVCTVDGDSLASTVRMTISGTGPSTVVGTILDIVCNHSLDILVTSQTSTYTTLTVKIVSNNNEDFAVQLKTNSTNNLPVNMEVFALNSETVTFTSTNPYTGASLEHECKNGGFASSSSGGATHGFYSNGSVLATAASVAAVAALDPVITLTGAVTGAGTMTNLGSVSITTTATSDPVLTLTGDVTGSATFTNLGNATLTTVVANDSHTHSIYLPISGKAADSELLDGIDSTSFLRSDAADSGGTTTGSSLNIPYLKTNMLLVDATNFGDTINGAPWYGLGKSTLVGYHSNNSTMSQLANYWGLRLQTQGARIDMTPTGYAANILFGAGTDVSGTTWARINSTGLYQGLSNLVWHAGNDGAGSTLDADLLDGQHGSYYAAASHTHSNYLTAETLSSTNSPVVTGTKYFQPAGSATSPLGGGGASLQAYTTGTTAAYMAFHRSGAYAINWGLDTSNTMVLGGWSSSTSAARMSIGTNGLMVTAGQGTLWGAGNDGSGSGLDADLLDGYILICQKAWSLWENLLASPSAVQIRS